MITASSVTKKFGSFTALDSLSCSIPDGCIYGLVGSNGAGKSTLMRLITGIYKPEGGYVAFDDQNVYENPQVKERFVFIPDELYFLPQANMNRMAKLYKASYRKFSFERFEELTKIFGLDPKANINTFSKGMKRQAATILGLACMSDYIFFDETFDGLDPIMRNLVKKVVYAVMVLNPIQSHSLRELEDTCDQLALLHKGGIVFESDINDLKTSLSKIQVAFDHEFDRTLFEGINILEFSKKGSVANIIIRGDREKAERLILEKNPVLLEVLPLSLEEVFVHEMGSLGYQFDDVLI